MNVCCRRVTSARSPIQEIIDIARNEKAGQVGAATFKVPAVDAISAKMDEAWRKSCGELTLRELIEEE